MKNASTSDLCELQKTIHKINVAKGWHKEPLLTKPVPDHDAWLNGEPDPAPEIHTVRVLAKLALVHTELCEAEEEWHVERYDVYFDDAKPTKPEGYVVELADAVIRALDICEALGLQMAGMPALTKGVTLHCYVAAATEAAREGDYTGRFVRALAGLRCACLRICEARGLDLHAAIELKIAYNRTRPHMHGGKLA